MMNLPIQAENRHWIGAHRLRLAEIADEVAREAGLSLSEIRERTRRHPVVYARQEAYLRQREAGYTLPQIARSWEYDHTTVLHGIRAAAKRREASR